MSVWHGHISLSIAVLRAVELKACGLNVLKVSALALFIVPCGALLAGSLARSLSAN